MRSCVDQPDCLKGSRPMRTDLGFGAAACQAGTGRTHRLKRRRRGRAQRGSTCGSRPLTPAVPERLRGRLWPEATKRIEYGTRVLEGKDNAPRRRMFIVHEPTKGSRAASKGRGSSRAWTGCASGSPPSDRRLLRLLRFLCYRSCLQDALWEPTPAPLYCFGASPISKRP